MLFTNWVSQYTPRLCQLVKPKVKTNCLNFESIRLGHIITTLSWNIEIGWHMFESEALLTELVSTKLARSFFCSGWAPNILPKGFANSKNCAVKLRPFSFSQLWKKARCKMSNRDRNKPVGVCKTSRLLWLHDKVISWLTIKNVQIYHLHLFSPKSTLILTYFPFKRRNKKLPGLCLPVPVVGFIQEQKFGQYLPSVCQHFWGWWWWWIIKIKENCYLFSNNQS